MTRFFAIAALGSTLLLGTAVDASAWTRNTTISGPRGTAHVQASGGCYGGSCSRSVTRTGPYGYTMTRNGSTSCSGGACYHSSVTTGPYGGTVTRQGTVTRY